jgi:hypothetical protein
MFELLLVRLTSALTLNVIGHAKDAVVIALAVLIFNESLSPANWGGVVLTLLAATVYSRLREGGGRMKDMDGYGPTPEASDADAAVGAAVSRLSQSVVTSLRVASPKASKSSSGDLSTMVMTSPQGMTMPRHSAAAGQRQQGMEIELPDVDTTRLGQKSIREEKSPLQSGPGHITLAGRWISKWTWGGGASAQHGKEGEEELETDGEKIIHIAGNEHEEEVLLVGTGSMPGRSSSHRRTTSSASGGHSPTSPTSSG